MIRINKNLAFFSSLFLVAGIISVLNIQKFSLLLGEVTYYCQNLLEQHMLPIPYFISIIPFIFFLSIVMIALVKLVILYVKVQFLRRKLQQHSTVQERVSHLIKSLGLEKKTIVINSSEKFAYCLGIRKPKIYLSTGLLSQLTLKEVEVVLRHEQYHLEKHDTFTMTIASVTYSLFPFFPVIRDLVKKYKIEREIEADKFATNTVGESYSLISALKKLLASPTVATVPLAAIADQDTLEPRIYALVQRKYQYRHFRIKHMLFTLFSFFIIGSILVIPVHAEETYQHEHDSMMICSDEATCRTSCPSKNSSKFSSAMPSSK